MINIAIDGPAGAGKSTIAKAVAARKNYIYVDTGAMYRAMALFILRKGIDPDDAVNGDVRRKLVELQQKLAREQNVVMDGRDIGTVVLPDAQVKIYLTASVDVRADRRYKELIEKGEEADLDEIRDQIRERDERDMNRDISPLRQADDAVLVDTSDLTIDEVADKILAIIDEKI